MIGQPLDFAKRAVLKLIKHLGQRDTLHFLTYDTQPEVIFQDGDLSESGKGLLKEKVLAVHAKGQTTLFGGLESAVALLGGAAGGGCQGTEKGERSVRRIFLFSDGRVNVGLTDPQAIRRKVSEWAELGITVSTFGIGVSFDEPLMRGIAESGKGRYTYLATARDIPKLVSKSVHGLLDLYASEALLDVRGGLHSTVSRLYGADEQDDAGDGAPAAPGLLSLGDLHHGSERRILVELEVAPPGGSSDGPAFAAAEWTITFQRRGATAQFSGRVELKVTTSRAALGEEAATVRATFAIQRAADLDLEVSQHLAQGDRVRARDAKARQLALLREALEAARLEDGAQADVEALARVLERGDRVAAQIEEGESSEVVRRQCIQEHDLNRAMSVADWGSGCDSDSGGDVANLEDLRSPGGSSSSSAASSPRAPAAAKLALLFCGPPNDPETVQRLLPLLKRDFAVDHVASVADGVSAIARTRYAACVAKLGTEGNLGVDVIKELRSQQGQDVFVAIHSATASRQPSTRQQLEQELGVDIFVHQQDEKDLIIALQEELLKPAGAPGAALGAAPGAAGAAQRPQKGKISDCVLA